MKNLLRTGLIFGHSAFAYSVFNTNCTLPSQVVNYVSSPNTRGTIDIAWSCIATIVVCVYTVLHLNLPRRPEHVSHERSRTLVWENNIFMPALMVLIGIFVPEWIFTVALMEYWDASYQLKSLKTSPRFRGDSERARRLRESWKLSHMFFANMGGFVLMHKTKIMNLDGNDALDSNTKTDSDEGEKNSRNNDIVQVSTLPNNVGNLAALNAEDSEAIMNQRRMNDAPNQHAVRCASNQNDHTASSRRERSLSAPPCILSGNIRPFDYICSRDSGLYSRAHANVSQPAQPPPRKNFDLSEFALERGYRYHLTAAVLRFAIQDGLLPPKAVDEEDIKERAKSDWFVKILVVFQLLSFWCNVLARVAEGLPICALEVATSAFALCSFLTYLLLFKKPQGAFAPMTLAYYDTIPEEIQQLKIRYLQRQLRDDDPVDQHHVHDLRTGVHGKPPYLLDPPIGLTRMLDMSIYPSFMYISGIVFGGIHLAGWSLEFPTETDRWLWRTSSLATTVIPTLALPLTLWFGRTSTADPSTRYWRPSKSRLLTMVIGYSITVYCVSRLILLVEMIRTLFYLPVAAYETPSWSIGIPHIS